MSTGSRTSAMSRLPSRTPSPCSSSVTGTSSRRSRRRSRQARAHLSGVAPVTKPTRRVGRRDWRSPGEPRVAPRDHARAARRRRRRPGPPRRLVRRDGALPRRPLARVPPPDVGRRGAHPGRRGRLPADARGDAAGVRRRDPGRRGVRRRVAPHRRGRLVLRGRVGAAQRRLRGAPRHQPGAPPWHVHARRARLPGPLRRERLLVGGRGRQAGPGVLPPRRTTHRGAGGRGALRRRQRGQRRGRPGGRARRRALALRARPGVPARLLAAHGIRLGTP